MSLYSPRAIDKLPEHAFSTGTFYGQEPEHLENLYWIATDGTIGFGGERVSDEQKRMEAAQDWVGHYLEDGDAVEGIAKMLADKIQNGELSPRSTIKVCYSVNFENSSTNLIPVVLGDNFVRKLSEKLEEKSVDLQVVGQPLPKISKSSDAEMNSFQRIVERSVFQGNESLSGSNVIIIDDDNHSSMSLVEMGSEVVRHGGTVLAFFTCLSLRGGERIPIHPAAKAELERVVQSNAGELDNPLETFNNKLKGFGLTDGIESLTNIEAFRMIAELSSPDVAMETIPAIWQESTGVGWQEYIYTFKGNREQVLFLISDMLSKPAITTKEAIDSMEAHYQKLREEPHTVKTKVVAI